MFGDAIGYQLFRVFFGASTTIAICTWVVKWMIKRPGGSI